MIPCPFSCRVFCGSSGSFCSIYIIVFYTCGRPYKLAEWTHTQRHTELSDAYLLVHLDGVAVKVWAWIIV